jgi:hypothetical protein
MIEVAQKLKKFFESSDLKLVLSDLYPNQSAADQFNKVNNQYIEYITTPVEASDVNKNLKAFGQWSAVCTI